MNLFCAVVMPNRAFINFYYFVALFLRVVVAVVELFKIFVEICGRWQDSCENFVFCWPVCTADV